MSIHRGRRALIIAVAAAVLAGAAAAQSTAIRGEISYEGDAVIPEGVVEIHVEGAAVEHETERTAVARVPSDGKSKTISFVLPEGKGLPAALEIVALLVRADGWLIARGSMQAETDGAPVHVTLNRAAY